MLNALRLLLLARSAAVAGCATPMSMREIEAVKPNCARIDDRSRRSNERKSRTIRGSSLAGVQSVAPALAALSLARGTYGRNVAIATGDWAAAIDRKLAELIYRIVAALTFAFL